MAAISVGLPYLDRRDIIDESLRLTTRLDDDRNKARGIDFILASWARRRCDSFCMEQDAGCRAPVPTRNWYPLYNRNHLTTHFSSANLLNIAERIVPSCDSPPPAYADATLDTPPDYTTPGNQAQAQPLSAHSVLQPSDSKNFPAFGSVLPIQPMTPSSIDFDDIPHVITHAKKKTKQAQKAADKAKWGEGDEEGNNPDGEGAGGGDGAGDWSGGGGAGGGEGNGNGGAGDGGGDGGGDDGGDDWDYGGNKKKKKGKKGKGGVDEEEEKKREEEERKKQAEAEAAIAAEELVEDAAGSLSWANETNTVTNDEWSGFAAKKKKGKKGKDLKNDPDPPVNNDAPASNFDDVNLLDDAPRLDLSFGNTSTKETSSGFGFSVGKWGNNWGQTKSSWGLEGAENTGTDITDTKISKDTNPTSAHSSESNTWSLGGNKKSGKGKTTISSFDFGGFTNLDETPEYTKPGVEEATKAPGEFDWGTGFTSVNKKDKKKKKGLHEDDTPNEADAVVSASIVDIAIGADDSWGSWGAKKERKSKAAEVSLPSPPAPVVEAPAVADDWTASITKKGKKGKKNVVEESAKTDEGSPAAINTVPETNAEGDWGAFSSKKEKNKNKKAIDEEPRKLEDVVYEPVAVVPEPETDDGWGFSLAKGKKKGKKALGEEIPKVEESLPEPFTAALDAPDEENRGTFGSKKKKGKKPEETPTNEDLISAPVDIIPEPETKDGWGNFSTKTKKKGKKGTDVVASKIDEPKPVEESETETEIDHGWGAVPSKKDKKSKNGVLGEKLKAEEPFVDVIAEKNPADAVRDAWGASLKSKKGKKGSIIEVQEDPVVTVESAAITEVDPEGFGGNDWNNWGAPKKNNKKRAGAKEMKAEEFMPSQPPPAPPAPPEVGEFLDASKDDVWATQTKSKKGKKGKVIDSEPAIVDIPEVVEEEKGDPVVADWGAQSLSPKDKKKKEKEDKRREEERKKEEEAKKNLKSSKNGFMEDDSALDRVNLLVDSVPDTAPVVVDTWGIWGPSKTDKKKGFKKDLLDFETPPAAPTPPPMGLTPEPEEDLAGAGWGSFAPAKGKKGTKTNGLSKDSSKDTKKSAKDFDFLAEYVDSTPEKVENEPKETPKEEPLAKVGKSFWGSQNKIATSKSKSLKEKAKEEEAKKQAEAEEKRQLDEEAERQAGNDAFFDDLTDDDDDEPIPEPVRMPLKSDAKAKAGSKLSRTTSKGSDKAGKAEEKKKDDFEALLDISEETSKDVHDYEVKSKTGSSKDKGDDKSGKDAWSFLVAKKTGVRKGDEGKKEISKQDWTNQRTLLGEISNGPEEAVADEGEEVKVPIKTTKMQSTKSPFKTSKVTGLSISERIKALEKEKKATATPLAAPPAPEPQPKSEDPPKKVTATSKSSKVSTPSKKRDQTSAAVKDDRKVAKDSVPGSFPSEGADDDIVEVIEPPPPPPADKRLKKKSAKAAAKEAAKEVKEPEPTSESEEAEMDDMIIEAPAPPGPPTPPPETSAAKTAKKERARVVRDEGSWGFWGSSPRKEVKKERRTKDDGDVTSPQSRKVSSPALSRSKSTKTPREKEKEEVSRSSASDKDKKPEPRPKQTTRSSFSLFGGPPPSRSKPIRRSSVAAQSKNSSRRPSIDIGPMGMPSPPSDNPPEMSAKAAKLMGMGPKGVDRKASTRGKQKAAAPDPYPIDDDDMVIVNGIEDPIINAPIPRKELPRDVRKDKGSKTKAKREVSPVFAQPYVDEFALPDRTKSSRAVLQEKIRADRPRKQSKIPAETADDIVMVEAGPANDGPEDYTEPEDIASVEKPREPPPLKRSATTTKKSDGLMGIFGSFRSKPKPTSDVYDRPKSKGIYGDEDGNIRRKRTVAGGGEDPKRIRRDDRKVRRSAIPQPHGEDFVTDAVPNGGGITEPEEAEARRERRARRAERDYGGKPPKKADKEQEERKARDSLNDGAAREARRALIREARERKAREDEQELRKEEEKTAKRSAKEEIWDDQIPQDLDGQPSEGRTKSASKEPEEPYSRPSKPHRRRTDRDLPTRTRDEEADRRARREDRHSRRSPNEKESRSRRKSAAPVDDYFDARNGARGPPADADPYSSNGANDHTSSWVQSQIIEPPPPPPIEPTVIEPPPDRGEGLNGDALEDDEDIRRSKRRTSRRRSRYVDATPDEADERMRRRERREKELKSSEGSGEADKYSRRKSDYPSARTPRSPGETGTGKRTSFFKKLAAF